MVTRPGNSDGRRNALVLAALGAALVASAAVSLVVAREQVSGWQMSQSALAASEGRRPLTNLRRAESSCGSGCSAYALTDAGGAWATVASRAIGKERRDGLERSHALLRRASALAPFSARTWVERAFVDSLDPDLSDADILEDIAKSYASAPFLPDRNHWRIRWASEHWTMLNPFLRSRVLDEAAWLQSIPADRGGAADGALGDTAAATALAFRGSKPRP